ncbi:hypothetical protein [Comamonas sp. B21-038]|uniref:hypothetical protein n=1 Tax=Comamonas sp. B21-038 TaxID=2918299 RepID=UPI001EFB5D68|nr:hypothetical protein [Comamonas sp. B21-038]ULR88559.1 hypothetical protein MJ205_19320 [Comamonas sp. B21-038]
MAQAPQNRAALRKRKSSWASLRMPQRITATLQEKHWLRLHGLCMGLLVMLVMWAVTAALLHSGVYSMALRYAISLGVGYGVYLLALRLWAAYLVRNAYARKRGDSWADGVDPTPGLQFGEGRPDWEAGGGGDFGGGGASGDWVDIEVSSAASNASEASSSWTDAVDVVDVGGDEAAIIIVPILAVFAGLLLAFFGFGALLWLYFGVDVLLSVAVELAFSMMTARALVQVERAGWLASAVRLTWKPLLGALVCAVALGALADWWVPDATTLREVIAHIRGTR